MVIDERHHRAAEYMMQGMTYTRIGEALNLHPEMIRSWTRAPEFQALVSELRKRLRDGHVELHAAARAFALEAYSSRILCPSSATTALNSGARVHDRIVSGCRLSASPILV